MINQEEMDPRTLSKQLEKKRKKLLLLKRLLKPSEEETKEQETLRMISRTVEAEEDHEEAKEQNSLFPTLKVLILSSALSNKGAYSKISPSKN